MLTEHRTTLAWIRAGWPAPSEIEARLNRIEDALRRLEALPVLAGPEAGASRAADRSADLPARPRP